MTGNAGDVVHDEVTVTGTDDDGGHPTNKGDADVPVTDIPTKLSVVKTASPETVQEGTRAIAFTITITNVLTFTQDGTTYTAVDDITVFSLQDDKLGDLDAAGDVTCKVGGVTKAWPITIGPGQSIVCTVTRNITGSPVHAAHEHRDGDRLRQRSPERLCGVERRAVLQEGVGQRDGDVHGRRRRRRTCRTAT